MAISISSVSGTVANGNTLTISGSGLQNQQNANWDTFWKTTNPNAWSFEGASYSADGYGSPASISSGCSFAYSTAKALFGSKSILANIVSGAGSFSCPADNKTAYTNAPCSRGFGSPGTFYTRAYGYWTQDGVNWPSYQKWIEALGQAGYNNYYMQPNNGGGTSPPSQFVLYATGNSTPSNPFGSFSTGKWICIESECTFDPTVANQRIRVWQDDVLVLDLNSGWTGEMRFQLWLFGIINGCHGSGNYDQKCYTDGMVLASSRIYPECIVEISDNSVYGAGTLVKQSPLFISDSSVQVVCDLTGLGAGPYYLFARNNAQEQSASFALSGGACSAPTNVDAPNAVSIASLPYSIVQDVHCSPTTYTVWYKYTTSASDKCLQVFPFGDLSVYTPYVRVYLGPDSAPVLYFTAEFNNNKGINIAVQPSTTYWFEFVTNSGNPSPAVLTLKVRSGPALTVSPGDILVTQDGAAPDEDTVPSYFVDQSGGGVKSFVLGLPSGEGGDILDSGYMMFEDVIAGDVKTFDNTFAFDTTLAFTPDVRIRTCKGLQEFFAAYGPSNPTVKRVDGTGAVVNTYTLTGMTLPFGMAASNDGTILYHADNSLTTSKIRRWNLPGAAALSDLAAAVSAYYVNDILVLSDDTIVAIYSAPFLGQAFVRRYNAAGTLLNTYAIGASDFPSGTPPRIYYGVDDPTSFWIWNHLSGRSVFSNIRVSDGAVLITFSIDEYEAGIYVPTATATPQDNFGPPFSCPFLVIPSGSSPPPPEETGALRVDKITIPASAVNFDFIAGGSLSPTSFMLANGQSQLFSDLTAGPNYSIAEVTNVNYSTGIVVSNGDDPSNITIDPGELVIVTVTNTLLPVAGSGIYQLVPGKRNDTLWQSDGSTQDSKIPDPYIYAFLIGD